MYVVRTVVAVSENCLTGVCAECRHDREDVNGNLILGPRRQRRRVSGTGPDPGENARPGENAPRRLLRTSSWLQSKRKPQSRPASNSSSLTAAELCVGLLSASDNVHLINAEFMAAIAALATGKGASRSGNSRNRQHPITQPATTSLSITDARSCARSW